jgi:nitrilase
MERSQGGENLRAAQTRDQPRSHPMKIAAVQMISGPEVAPNLERAEQLIAQAAQAGARLVALPEYFPLIGATDHDRLGAREPSGSGPIQDFLASAARRHGIWLLGGSLPLHANQASKLRNTLLVFDPNGEQAARYDKIHLFSFRKGEESYDESRTIEAGNKPTSFAAQIDGTQIHVGLGICYDLRFPELFRAMNGDGGLDLIVLPAAFTDTTGRAHWELLLRARAVENQCYVLAPAQGGRHPTGRMTHGNSLLIDPWGDVVARMPGDGKGEGVVCGDLDLHRLSEVRTSLPALVHRTL